MAQEFCFRDARVEELADEEVPRHTVPKWRTTARVVFHFRLDDSTLFSFSRDEDYDVRRPPLRAKAKIQCTQKTLFNSTNTKACMW
mmetsp:Transcript_2702/g.8681  ORF Transcript_2702/g.8681 Transcript_2702/m.8681 type:complete len:86 (-) Transcript_2702:54-311(-)